MSSLPQQFPVEQWFHCICTGANDIALSGTGVGIGGANGERGSEFGGKGLRFFGGAAAYQDRRVRLEPGKHMEVGAGFASGAEDGERRGTLTCKMPGGERGGSGGTDFGKGVGGESGHEAGVARIEEEIGGLDRGMGIPGNGNELHAEGMGWRVEAGHGEEDAIRSVDVRAVGENDAGIAVAESGFESGDQWYGIEKAADLGVGELVHGDRV